MLVLICASCTRYPENLLPFDPPDARRRVQTPDAGCYEECPPGLEFCVPCPPCSPDSPEVCDGRDNDCDGIIDGTASMPLSRWCWDNETGVNEEVHFEPCRTGVQVCDAGQWGQCLGAVSPIQEQGTLACDDTDNNCDGCIDGNLVEGICQNLTVDGFDIIFAIDTSGSMLTTINAVRDAISRFTTLYASNPDFKFGIVLIPGMMDSQTELFLDLSDFTTFQTAMMSPRLSGPGGSEATIDAIYRIGSGGHTISWRRNTIRIIIMFGDEHAQTYDNPLRTMTEACETLSHGEVLIKFITSANSSGYAGCGTDYELNSDPDRMFNDLTMVISDPCIR